MANIFSPSAPSGFLIDTTTKNFVKVSSSEYEAAKSAASAPQSTVAQQTVPASPVTQQTSSSPIPTSSNIGSLYVEGKNVYRRVSQGTGVGLSPTEKISVYSQFGDEQQILASDAPYWIGQGWSINATAKPAVQTQPQPTGVSNIIQHPSLPTGFGADPATGQIVKLGAPPAETGPKKESGESLEDFISRLSSDRASSSSLVETSTLPRAEALAEIKKQLLPTLGLPDVPKTAEERIRLRREQGIVSDEADLQAIREESALANQELRVFKSKAGERVTEAGRLGAVNEAERNLSFRLEGLAIRERAVVDRINSKNSYIDQAIRDQTTDYNAATARWDMEFGINAKATEILNSQLEEDKKDALTVVTTLHNLLSEKGLTYDQFPESFKQQLQSAALRINLPQDTFAVAYSGIDQGQKVISHFIQDTPSGGKDVYTLTQDAQGGIKLNRVAGIPASGVAQGGGDLPASVDEYNYAQSQGFKGSYLDFLGTKAQTVHITSGTKPTTYDYLSANDTKLEGSRGSDGFYNTNQYNSTFKDYVFRGGTPSEFFKLYPAQGNLNPNDPTAQIFLRQDLYDLAS